MHNFRIMSLNTICFVLPLMVIGSGKAAAFEAETSLLLPMVNSAKSWLNNLTETQEFLLTGNGILLIGFLLWVAYIVVFPPKDSLTKR